MSCVPCAKARAAMERAARDVASGNLRTAAAQLPKVADALREKVEAARVRVRLALRRDEEPRVAAIAKKGTHRKEAINEQV